MCVSLPIYFHALGGHNETGHHPADTAGQTVVSISPPVYVQLQHLNPDQNQIIDNSSICFQAWVAQQPNITNHRSFTIK